MSACTEHDACRCRFDENTEQFGRSECPRTLRSSGPPSRCLAADTRQAPELVLWAAGLTWTSPSSSFVFSGSLYQVMRTMGTSWHLLAPFLLAMSGFACGE